MKFSSLSFLAIMPLSFCFFVGIFWAISPSFGEENSRSERVENSQEIQQEISEEGKRIKSLAEEKKKQKLARIEKEYEAYIDRVEAKYEDKIQEKRAKISLLHEKLESTFLQFDEGNQNSKESSKNIVESAQKSHTLKSQIKAFDIKISDLQKRIDLVNQRIRIKENQISILAKEKSKSSKAQEIQKEMIMDYFHLYQVADEEFLGGKDLEKSLETLFTQNASVENLQEVFMIQEMEKQSRKMFYQLDSINSRIGEANLKIQKENEKILALRKYLEEKKSDLKTQKYAKRNLLLQTENSEIEYKKLWEKSLAQMHAASEEVKSIRAESEEINTELQKLERQKQFEQKILTKKRLREKMIEEIAESNNTLSVDQLGKLFSFESSELAPLKWPVEPIKGISAYFHDKKYKKYFKREHNAIDIPTPQGTPIRAATAGYVYKSADNGMGYSYIILLHRDNIRTVYGHISEIQVKEGQMVGEGEIIGKSGGMPGTKGAGTLTTGPHLHFEVLEGETHRNPLEYLSLGKLE